MMFEMARPVLDTARKKAEGASVKEEDKTEERQKKEKNKKKVRAKEDDGKEKETENEIENEIEIEIERECEHGRARFDIFWDAYPRKVDKQRAWEQFRKVEEPLQVLLVALQNHKRSDQWLEEGGRYIPRPAQWLKQQRWQDRLSAPEGKVPMGATGELGQAELEAIRKMLREG